MSQDTVLDIHQIRALLPHRYPFLLLDRVLDYKLHTYLKAIKNVTVNEPCFTGHFPERPVYPGVLILESIAQASAVLAHLGFEDDAGENVLFLFAGIDNARFKRQVEPGNQLHFHVEQTNFKRKVWKFSATATVEGEVAASADIIFTYRNY